MQSNADANKQRLHGVAATGLSDPPDHARLLSLEPSTQINGNSHPSNVSLRSVPTGNQSDTFPGINPMILIMIANAEAEERKQWAKRHPGTALDRDQLLREVNHDAERPENGVLLQMLRMLRGLRELVTDTLAPHQGLFQLPILAQLSNPFGPKTLCDASRSWAVIIGIDAYEHLERLQGCVNDAFLMHEFLTDNLKIPDHRVTILTTDQDSSHSQWPTRDNIIHALYNLRDNGDIKVNDNIIIYFSGHGTRYQTSASSVLSQQVDPIDALCAVDHGPKVPGISDRELNRIIQEIYAVKGNNIVVILDACYSGGMARGGDASGTYIAARSVNHTWDDQDLDRMLHAADQHPRRRSTTDVFSPLWTSDPPPCIFMAACRSTERAWERTLGPHNRIHGVFTYMLVKTLKLCLKGRRMTYEDIEAKLAILLSHPQAPTGLQHVYFMGDGKSCKLWYQVYGWVQGSVSMALVDLLIMALGDSLCRTHQPYPNVRNCNDCLATHRALKALDAQVEFSKGIHPELRALQEELCKLRKMAKMETPVMEQSSMPDLNPSGGNLLRGFLSLPTYVTSVPNLNFPYSRFHELRNMMDAAELQAQTNGTQE